MSSKQKPPPHWMVALAPLSGGSVLRARWRNAILIGDDATEDEQKQLYELLYKLKWFPPKARDAILQASGSTRRKQKSDDETRRLMRLQHRINKGAAYKQIAAAEGITVGTLTQQLKRFKRRARLEGAQIARIEKEIARRKAEEGRIEKLYHEACSGVQIDTIDISKVFHAGRKAIALNCAITDAELTKVIVDFIQKKRKQGSGGK
jgi:hypothetical protein